MAIIRHCRWCRRILDPTAPRVDDSARRRGRPHCGSPTCDWCEWCYQKRSAAIKAGRGDLLDKPPGDTPPTQT